MQNLWGLVAVRHFVASTDGPFQARGAMVLVRLYVHTHIYTQIRYTQSIHKAQSTCVAGTHGPLQAGEAMVL